MRGEGRRDGRRTRRPRRAPPASAPRRTALSDGRAEEEGDLETVAVRLTLTEDVPVRVIGELRVLVRVTGTLGDAAPLRLAEREEASVSVVREEGDGPLEAMTVGLPRLEGEELMVVVELRETEGLPVVVRDVDCAGRGEAGREDGGSGAGDG